MKQFLLILTLGLLTLFITACSSFRSAVYSNNASNQSATNFTLKPLALATKAYELMEGNADSKRMVADDLERAYSANGTTPTVINRLLKKHDEAKTPDAKDDELDTLARRALDEKKPNFKKALTIASAIKNPVAKSKILLRIAEDMPKNKRLPVLREADKAITLSKINKVVYHKRSKLLKLAKLYFESGDKQNARKTILASHDLLIRNTSSINARDFGTVAELESQLGIQPSTLCKLTRFLHKTKDRPIALAKITAAYLSYGYHGQICIPDKELIAAVKNMPDVRDQVTEQLVLAEAWHARKEKNKSSQLYRGAIKSAKSNLKYNKFVIQGKVLVSLQKTSHTKLFNHFSNYFWKQINKIKHPYQQSEALMQMIIDSYLEGLPDMSLHALSKMKENSLKVNLGLDLARMAHKKKDQVIAKKALNTAFLAAKTTSHPVPKMDWLRYVIDTAHELGDTEIVEKALKESAKSVTKVPNLDLKVMYATLLTKQAWEHKDYRLAQELLKQNQLWYKQWIEKPKITKKDASNAIDYYEENKRNALIDLIKANVLLGNKANAIALLDSLPSNNLQVKALAYAAITLAEKRKEQAAMKMDTIMFSALESKFQRIRENLNLKNKI